MRTTVCHIITSKRKHWCWIFAIADESPDTEIMRYCRFICKKTLQNLSRDLSEISPLKKHRSHLNSWLQLHPAPSDYKYHAFAQNSKLESGPHAPRHLCCHRFPCFCHISAGGWPGHGLASEQECCDCWCSDLRAVLHYMQFIVQLLDTTSMPLLNSNSPRNSTSNVFSNSQGRESASVINVIFRLAINYLSV